MINTVIAQEKELTFNSLQHSDAFNIGQYIIDEVKKFPEKAVRIRVVLNGDIVFQYLMNGKDGEEWLDKKQKTVERFHHSSYYIYLLNEKTHEYEGLKNDYAICGGGFPLIVNGIEVGCICVSGLSHEEDHQLIIHALSVLKRKCENKIC